ncbi:MAG: 4'-phosphopantetheinyl transferase superfamily protein [Proteobacteria bacterium]|nr:4'-phosphopantetheinyl transferase superfamily protein [Pseudomonadota bacterium]MBU4471748.1 4'-phosphopantetheinyl transferase superfamily protein [Pseudomonadota bacterium]MCG2750529.1 4'-phosphopantetheinyl transferase superfamily protein [Desulfobacteraceae bacterium]
MEILNPVILAVLEEKKGLSGREKVKFLSDHARKALGLSADFSGIRLGKLEKDENGVPLPSGDYFWSLSHKPLYVGGVVSNSPVGLDIEQIREISPGLFKKTASQEEWALGKEPEKDLFFRFWTAKEAVIKANGTGIRDLLKCRVTDIIDSRNLMIRFQNKTWQIENMVFNGHTAAVVCSKQIINWTILREENSCI